jgi:hypothetical protein
MIPIAGPFMCLIEMEGAQKSEANCCSPAGFARERRSGESVFRFRESYAAEKYHNTRNVGVIGVALFNEIGSDPWTDEEVRRRLKANPFPGRFATPP